MIALPKEIRDAVRSQREPVRLTDPDTQQAVRRGHGGEVRFAGGQSFQRMNPYPQKSGQQLLIQAGLRAAWDDPAMDIYNDLDPRRQK